MIPVRLLCCSSSTDQFGTALSYIFLKSQKGAMASNGDQLSEMKSPHDSSIQVANVNLEAGLVSEFYPIGCGDTKNDLADMQRLGKKQEFKVRIILSILHLTDH